MQSLLVEGIREINTVVDSGDFDVRVPLEVKFVGEGTSKDSCTKFNTLCTYCVDGATRQCCTL